MTLNWPSIVAPDLEQFRAAAARAFDELPAAFRGQCGDIVIHVADFADDALLEQLGLEDPYELSGLYEGVDITRQSIISDIARTPNHIHLYRLPLLAEWAERGNISLGELITHVLVHEIGHHFGLSDDDMHRIEDANF
ncbi:MAG: metallopeptidase family protein [Parvularculaceae bacterium]|nr:metallopeptidase family protein [Parvularculaceae bacterium]